MLHITVPAQEFWDETAESFIYAKETNLVLEHSLVSISKWEAKWNKAFLGKTSKTVEETIDYIRCMTVTPNIDSSVYFRINSKIIEQINTYIDSPMSATWFSEIQNKKASAGNETVTSELIYYWMIAYNIPFECQKWHLNRLLTLIRICNIKNQDPKKMSKNDILRNNAALNAARRKKFHTKG